MPNSRIRNHDAQATARSRVRAALVQNEAAPADLGAVIAARFKHLGGVELALPSREPVRDPRAVDIAAASPAHMVSRRTPSIGATESKRAPKR